MMRILFCCEFYYPSVGGVQEVMRHLAFDIGAIRRTLVVTLRNRGRSFKGNVNVRIQQITRPKPT